MKENARAAVMASFAADSLALGAHWIYDTAEIDEKIGRVGRLLDPPEGGFHAGKKAGDFTHYGDQTLVLLRSLVANQGFDLQHFAEDWRGFMSSYKGYFDQATKGTLAGFNKGLDPESAGSRSNDLAGASRIAPLVFALHEDEPALTQAAREQTRMTHQDPGVVESAAFFASTARAVLQGARPVEALEQSSQAGYQQLPVRQWAQNGLAAAAQDSVSALAGFGITCHLPDAFPGTVQLIARHQDDLQEALIQNVMAGGDSAARGLLVGMVLGAWHGLEALPAAWLQTLVAGQEIRDLLSRL